MPTGTPTFQFHAHVVTVNGVAPTGADTFYFEARGIFGGLTSPALFGTCVGAADSGWLALSGSNLTAVKSDYDAVINPALYTYPFEGFGWWLTCTYGNRNTAPPLRTLIAGELKTDETGVVVPFSALLDERSLGVLVYRADPTTGLPNTTGAATIKTYAQYLDAVATPALSGLTGVVPPLPTQARIKLGGFINEVDYSSTYNASALACGKAQGHNFATIDRPLPSTKDALAAAGLTQYGAATFNLPGYMFPWARPQTGLQSPEQPDAAGIAAWAQKWRTRSDTAGHVPADFALMNGSDEPSWRMADELYAMTNGPAVESPPGTLVSGSYNVRDTAAWNAALASFRAYVQSRGFTAADIGHADFTDVFPLGKSHSTGTLAERRLFYCSCMWFAQSNATLFGDCLTALRLQFPGVDLAANFNNGSGRVWSNYALNVGDTGENSTGAPDWFWMAGKGLVPWTEDYLQDSYGSYASSAASRLWSAAKYGGVGKAGVYWTTAFGAGAVPGGLLRKRMAGIGHGIKYGTDYYFGPSQWSSPENSQSDRWVRDLHIAPDAANTARLVAGAEDLIGPGIPPPAKVAILHPRSSFPWDAGLGYRLDNTLFLWEQATVDYLVEAQTIQLALFDASVDSEWICEDQLNSTALAQFRVLIVTAPNLSAANQNAIAAWSAVAGNVLVTTPCAGTRDEYNEPLTTVSTLGGITESYRARVIVDNLASWGATGAPIVTGTVVPGSHAAHWDGTTTNRTAITGVSAGNVEATFGDGTPAIVSVPVGSGRRYHFAWLPGVTYWFQRTTVSSASTVLPVGFSALVRSWITRPILTLAGIVPPVQTNVAQLEAPMLSSPAGCAVVLINWTNTPVTPTLTIRPVDAAGAPMSIRAIDSQKAGPLSYTDNHNGSYTVSSGLTVTDVDVLRAYVSASTTTAGKAAALLLVD